ncbi:auxin-responsive protein IAA11-like isoform X2 [Prosopis cineraria]|uniref:auxin-responsive protein IAA11-like isoform X2 n=1 Tax=Prosopis cineraria TaxID=364024 RepID=UPI00240F788C|nr:auxin-responsive protein IAA11-like isoform X2 [Prosopis cineraria]
MQGGSTDGSMSTVSKEDNLFISSEDSSCPDESELELGLGLSLSRRPGVKSRPTSTNQHARILTAKDFLSMASSHAAASLASSTSSPSSSSSSPSSVTRPNVTAGTKRTSDSVVATNGLSQVVGWPPLGAYRMNSFNNHAKSPAGTKVFNSVVEKSKNNETEARKNTDNGINKSDVSAKGEGNLKSSRFVKVNMDGLLIGRKVDLSAHNSYESLALTLEEMFDEHFAAVNSKRSTGEEHGAVVGSERRSKLLDASSKFALTYEDKDGDWMLVGDVPWGMFLSCVRRLKIMRTSEAKGLAPMCEGKNSRQRS